MKELSPWAAALLRRSASGPEGDAISGDIAEFARLGRSRMWVWRQIVSAMLQSSKRDIRSRAPGSLAAVAAGWATLLAVFGVSSLVAPEPLGLWTLWLNVGPAGVVPWTHWWNSMLDWRVATLWCVGFAMSGWLVVRFRPAALLMFTIVVMAWGLTSTVVLMFAPAWYGLRWHAPYPDPTTFVLQAVAYLLLIVVVSPMLILIGGVAGPLASRSRPMGSR